jgi:pantoate--beta-alanine ligase
LKVVSSLAELAKEIDSLKSKGKSIGFVPTMGALHEGHASLLRAAAKENDSVVLSIYVNPTQFGKNEDLAKYPRTLEADLKIAEAVNVSIVFLPTDAEIYPPGFSTFIEVTGVSNPMCGKFRPGHFRGVATVVHRLFLNVKPTRAYFGLKDLQQCLVLNRMNKDMDIAIELRFLPTFRESDGLALSSRNRYLTAEERVIAPRIFKSLSLVAKAFADGERSRSVLMELGRNFLSQETSYTIQYFEVLSLPDLQESAKIDEASAVAVAAMLGKTRLIDNLILGAFP